MDYILREIPRKGWEMDERFDKLSLFRLLWV
jgi:hypothetical protein